MDPVLTLKRSSQVDVNACIFCQTRLRDEHLRAASDYSRTVVRDAMNLRSKFRDIGNRETISRLEEVITSTDVSIVWHVKCYSLFTSKDKIQRLQKKCNKDEASAKPTSSPRKTRAQTEQVYWDKCAFCQVHTNERLSSVMTFKMSEQIIEISKFDKILCTRFAGISDLIAAEAKYHLSCFSASKRSRDKTKTEKHWFGCPMNWSMQLTRAVLLDLDAWERYTTLVEKAGIALPSSFVSQERLLRTNLCIWLETL